MEIGRPMGRGPGDGVGEEPGEIAGLIRRAKTADRAAFGELYRIAVTPVYRYMAIRLNEVEEAEEITQEVFTAALRETDGLRAEDEAGLLGWLFQIARHKLADHLRRRYRRPTAPLDEADRVAAPAWPADDGAEVREALEQLTPDQRAVVVCKYILGYDNQRTADLVGKNSNAVNQLHHRALVSLHRLLANREKAR